MTIGVVPVLFMFLPLFAQFGRKCTEQPLAKDLPLDFPLVAALHGVHFKLLCFAKRYVNHDLRKNLCPYLAANLDRMIQLLQPSG